ncbi:unannotated protein [freshwater metagenome]|uniref:Unannotated protein n=1 Tax=freshwater metagenome TaxID=449393 RepID=A0A6J7M6Y4_9ZZZZ
MILGSIIRWPVSAGAAFVQWRAAGVRPDWMLIRDGEQTGAGA